MPAEPWFSCFCREGGIPSDPLSPWLHITVITADRDTTARYHTNWQNWNLQWWWGYLSLKVRWFYSPCFLQTHKWGPRKSKELMFAQFLKHSRFCPPYLHHSLSWWVYGSRMRLPFTIQKLFREIIATKQGFLSLSLCRFLQDWGLMLILPSNCER